MKVFAIICTVLVFAYANPIAQTRSEECLAALQDHVKMVPMMVIETLGKTICALSKNLPEPVQDVLEEFEDLVMTALEMGPKVIEALTNPCPTTGLEQFANASKAMLCALNDVVKAVTAVCAETGAELQGYLEKVMGESETICEGLKAALMKALSGDEPTSLVEALDQDTIAAMKQLMECCMKLMCGMAEKFIGAMSNM